MTVDTISSAVSIRELRAQLADVLGRAGYGGQRIGITRNGKLAAVVIGVEDLEALEAYELERDAAAYRAAKAADDGTRVSLEELRADLDDEESTDVVLEDSARGTAIGESLGAAFVPVRDSAAAADAAEQ